MFPDKLIYITFAVNCSFLSCSFGLNLNISGGEIGDGISFRIIFLGGYCIFFIYASFSIS